MLRHWHRHRGQIGYISWLDANHDGVIDWRDVAVVWNTPTCRTGTPPTATPTKPKPAEPTKTPTKTAAPATSTPKPPSATATPTIELD